MSFISRIPADLYAEQIALPDRLFDLAVDNNFFITCNQAIKAAKKFQTKMLRVRRELDEIFNEPVDTSARASLPPEEIATEAQLEDALERMLGVEQKLSKDWELQRKQITTLKERLQGTPGMRQVMLTRVLNAINQAYFAAVTTVRDGRTKLMVALDDMDDSASTVLGAPEQVRAYFGTL